MRVSMSHYLLLAAASKNHIGLKQQQQVAAERETRVTVTRLRSFNSAA